MVSEMKSYDRMYIDGEWVHPQSATPFALVNPATEEVFATVSLGGPHEVDKAVQAGRRAFPAFSNSSKTERIGLLEAIIASFGKREEDILAALTQEMGAPRTLRAHTTSALAGLKQAAQTLADYEFEVRVGGNIIRREAIGVAGLITPWNWPIQLLCNKLASAFAAGCPVVVKPSEFTPVSALILAEVMHDAGVPKGVFNLVLGDGPGVGHAISSHPGVDIVSFTGSTRAGVLVAQAAAGTVKRVAQELGGKAANIVLPDSDLKAAAHFNVTRGFSNTGQSCHSPTRLLVHRDNMDEMVGYLKEAASRIRVGDPNDPTTTMGPVVNRAQFERVQLYIKIGLEEGATAIVGGLGRPEGLNRGYFVRPTIFTGVTPAMTIAQEEIFGPVTAVIAYDTEDEAMTIANGTPYGLGAYLFGRDETKALEMARKFQAGRVFFNGAPPSTAVPMGGYKMSGNGREMGVFGMEEYLETKAILGFAS
jgi:aldehyde dehydrogenase (NAD+)